MQKSVKFWIEKKDAFFGGVFFMNLSLEPVATRGILFYFLMKMQNSPGLRLAGISAFLLSA